MPPPGEVVVKDPNPVPERPALTDQDVALLREYTGFLAALIPELRGVPIAPLAAALQRFLRTR
jgi:hypothetical protein